MGMFMAMKLEKRRNTLCGLASPDILKVLTDMAPPDMVKIPLPTYTPPPE
jgi:hypothetical protein